MRLSIVRFALVICLIATVGALAACDKEGPAEKTGKSLDNAGQSVKDAIDPPGPAQKAGRALDNATGSK
ncbi:MAG TPA: hypothetical protein VM689_20275 [Aliidongia sp.]|nr:hypothetical protein [Aliidongia sp.]